MPRLTGPQIITANDLLEGDTVFLGPEGWTREIAEARVASSEAEASALETEALRDEARNLVVGPYLVAVTVGANRPWPLLRREQIRAERAPTVPVGPASDGRIARAA